MSFYDWGLFTIYDIISLFWDWTEENFPDQYIMVESFVNIYMVDISKFWFV